MKLKRNFLPIFLSLLPVILILAVLRVYPIVVAVMKSFTNWDGLYQSDWVGLQNYVNFVKGGPFWMILRNTFILMINVPLQVFIGLVVALLLYEKVKGWQVYRAVIYTPQIISAVIIGFLFKIFFGFNGPFNSVLRAIGLEKIAIEWFGNSYTALAVIVFSVVWFSIGWQAIVILGGMSTIPPSVFEAAIIDGAGYWRRAFGIVVPMLVRVLEFCIIASGVWTLTQLFPFLFAMTRGGPGYETSTLDYMIYLKSFGLGFGRDYGTATAIAVMLLILVLILTLIEMRVANRADDWS
ncbi:MAG: sugar ABC transporter permease [Spirochaetaceae bacterium]|nr:MAG: sugar ABC transporter permease [Spirochaetaceae bacterium]